jgi:hypothetical protein
MLTLIRRLTTDSRKAIYECDCGNRLTVFTSNVVTGHTQSCGCYRRKVTSERSMVHGHKANGRRSRTYVVWMNMKARCNNPTARLYSRYGGRGITYAPAWESFEQFLRDMGECPPGLTIERNDPDGNYTKRNCRWATRKEQAVNKSNVTLYEYQGRRNSVAGWAREFGIERLTLRYRLQHGWPIERALTEPVK